MTHVTIDVRMAHLSGIGTYINEVVPRVMALWAEARFTLLGDPVCIRDLRCDPARTQVREFRVPIYSISEQMHLPRVIPRDTTLYWAPHYNIPLAFRGAVATTVHDVFHLADPGQSAAKRVYATAMFASVVRRSRLVLCDSRFTLDELERRAGRPRASLVVPLGVSDRWFELATDLAPMAEPYFLAVGNVKPHKNLKRLLAAFQLAAPSIPHRLVIVGRREGLLTIDREVEAMASALGARVLFTGHVEREILERYVAGCAALVQPSLYEGFGLPPLEAMACGRAAAVSNAASLPEVCGPEAVYFDPLDVGELASVLLRLAAPGGTAPERAPLRREWARRYDWDVCASATTEALRQCGGVAAPTVQA